MMLNQIVSVIAIAAVTYSGYFTKPVTIAENLSMSPTLTESSPGTYLQSVTPTSKRGVRKVKIDNTDIITECRGKLAPKAIIKFDGFTLSCRFHHV